MTPERVIDLSKYIEKRHFGERPHIRGRRLPVAVLALNAKINNKSIDELAREYTLSDEQVLAALLYYNEHQDEIDAQEMAEQQAFDEMFVQHIGVKLSGA
jgi:uncharacterized protein (DUF433 family)